MNQEITTGIDIANVAGQIGPNSKRVYGNDAKRFYEWLLSCGLTPEMLTRTEMIAYRDFLGGKYASITAQRMLSVARRILQEQVYSGKLATNPAEGVRGFKVDNETTHTALTIPQAKELFQSVNISSVKGLRDYALMMLLLRTGIRRSECAALNIGDLREEQGHTVGIIQHGKGDKRGKFKVPVDVLRAIDEYLKARSKETLSPDAPLFVGFDRGDTPTHERLSDKGIERVVKYYGDKIGVEITPHCLRATFITLSLEGGAQLHQVQYAARHSDPRTTERYQKRKLNLDDNAVDYIRL